MPGVVAVLWAPDLASAEALLPSAQSLLASSPGLDVVLGVPSDLDPTPLASLMALPLEQVSAPNHVTLLNDLISRGGRHVAVAVDSVIVPTNWSEHAVAWLDEDIRIASVSFFSNAPGPVCFPWRDTPTSHHVDHFDEIGINRKLRRAPTGPQRTRISWGAGPLVLLGETALEAVGQLVAPPDGDASMAVADWCARARRRGFSDVLDPATFVTCASDLTSREQPLGEASPWFAERHPQLVAVDRAERDTMATPFSIAHGAARARVLGLRVLVDGRCFGPLEMGSQVQTLQLIRTLADQPDVRAVHVMLETAIPPYARDVLSLEHIDARQTDKLETFGEVDIIHRPYQPEGFFDAVSWSATEARLFVTVQDLLAYEGSTYHRTAADWAHYRDGLRSGVQHADGVVVISDDVRERVIEAALPLERDRLFVVANGTDHLVGDEPGCMPAELAARGFTGEQFVVCVGANFAHKNRDLAIRVVDELAQRGHDLTLVLAGAAVPSGSSRIAEAEARQSAVAASSIVTIPDVSNDERNWLLRHASVVLYPTTNEGFGLVPFEAARFGTPTVIVRFGPLQETIGHMPVLAESWEPNALADAAERLLRDPAVARAQVEAVVAAGTTYTWASTGTALVAAYYEALGRPRRRPTGRAV